MSTHLHVNNIYLLVVDIGDFLFFLLISFANCSTMNIYLSDKKKRKHSSMQCEQWSWEDRGSVRQASRADEVGQASWVPLCITHC